jgi:hypothetical protein
VFDHECCVLRNRGGEFGAVRKTLHSETPLARIKLRRPARPSKRPRPALVVRVLSGSGSVGQRIVQLFPMTVAAQLFDRFIGYLVAGFPYRTLLSANASA